MATVREEGVEEKLTRLVELSERTLESLDRMNALLSAAQGATLTEEEAARLIGVSAKYLAGIRAQGKISFISIGGGEHRHGRVVYTREDIIEYLKRNRRKLAG